MPAPMLLLETVQVLVLASALALVSLPVLAKVFVIEPVLEQVLVLVLALAMLVPELAVVQAWALALELTRLAVLIRQSTQELVLAQVVVLASTVVLASALILAYVLMVASAMVLPMTPQTWALRPARVLVLKLVMA